MVHIFKNASWVFKIWFTFLINVSWTETATSFRYYSPYYHKNFEINIMLEAPASATFFCPTGGLHLTLGLEDKVIITDLVLGPSLTSRSTTAYAGCTASK
jgi:hypothetical protein